LNMVYRDSVQTLYHSCPQLSRSLTVSTQDQGEVLVRGEVATLEDRLAISRALKSVAGCNCVRNQVRARAAGLNAITTVASKAPVQDNSLLVRLGIMQPRMEPVHSAPMIARAEPTREVPGLTASKPQVASLPAPGSSTLKKPATVPPVVTPVSLEQPRVTESPILLTSAPERHDTSKLRSSIASTCGVPETWVKVVAGEGKSLTITLAVADLESGQHLAEKVLALPELVPFGVSLDVTLAKELVPNRDFRAQSVEVAPFPKPQTTSVRQLSMRSPVVCPSQTPIDSSFGICDFPLPLHGPEVHSPWMDSTRKKHLFRWLSRLLTKSKGSAGRWPRPLPLSRALRDLMK
jgi:hypothetical protein